MANRMCDSCGGVDDHPRHVHGLGEGEEPTSPAVAKKALENAGGDNDAVLAHVYDKATQMKHLDCCQADGCPDGSCDVILAGDAKGLKGKDLRSHLISGSVNHVGWELTNAAVAKANKENS